MGRACLSLGSNIDPERHIALAFAALRERFGDILASAAYRTPAVGFEGADFVNAAAVIDSDLEPVALNDWLHALEDAHGRDRSGPRFGDRTLDIDIVLYDALVSADPATCACPARVRHAFVLRPLAEIAPGIVEPSSGRTLADLWRDSPERDVAMQEVALPAVADPVPGTSPGHR